MMAIVESENKPSTWGYWLGNNKADNTLNDKQNINPYLQNLINIPWPSLSYYPPKETHDVLERRQQLYEDLATLAKGTIPMGRPGRIAPPTYGVIAEQRVSQLGRSLHTPDHERAGAHHHTLSRNPIAHSFPENKYTVQATTFPKPRFEVRTSSSTLPTHLADFFASTTAQSHDSGVSDENKPPLHPFEGETALGPIMTREVPEPRLRVKREPFTVLPLTVAQDEPESKVTEQGDASETVYGDVSSALSTDGKCRLKGLQRLRAKAPPPIDMGLVNQAAKHEKAYVLTDTPHHSAISLEAVAVSRVDRVSKNIKHEITNAPVISNVPLPPILPIASRTRVYDEWKLMLLAPMVRLPRRPITPNRQALLDILNGTPLVDGRVGEDRRGKFCPWST